MILFCVGCWVLGVLRTGDGYLNGSVSGVIVMVDDHDLLPGSEAHSTISQRDSNGTILFHPQFPVPESGALLDADRFWNRFRHVDKHIITRCHQQFSFIPDIHLPVGKQPKLLPIFCGPRCFAFGTGERCPPSKLF